MMLLLNEICQYEGKYDNFNQNICQFFGPSKIQGCGIRARKTEFLNGPTTGDEMIRKIVSE